MGQALKALGADALDGRAGAGRNACVEEGVKGRFGFFQAKDGAGGSHDLDQEGQHALGQPFQVFSLGRSFGKFQEMGGFLSGKLNLGGAVRHGGPLS